MHGFPDASAPPYVAIITETDACDSEARMEATLESIQSAVQSNHVALVSVRVVGEGSQEFSDRVVELIDSLVRIATKNRFWVVVSSDLIGEAVKGGAHGIHVKEKHRGLIPEIRELFPFDPLIGTSAHSVQSALDAWSLYRPSYYFVGTCFLTESHPEKSEGKLEGPKLPGQVALALKKVCTDGNPATVFAIGGINESNCHEPVSRYGADGVATIRAVLQADDPSLVVQNMVSAMQKGEEDVIVSSEKL